MVNGVTEFQRGIASSYSERESGNSKVIFLFHCKDFCRSSGISIFVDNSSDKQVQLLSTNCAGIEFTGFHGMVSVYAR